MGGETTVDGGAAGTTGVGRGRRIGDSERGARGGWCRPTTAWWARGRVVARRPPVAALGAAVVVVGCRRAVVVVAVALVPAFVAVGFFVVLGAVVVAWCFGAGLATVAFRIVEVECFDVVFLAVRPGVVGRWETAAGRLTDDETETAGDAAVGRAEAEAEASAPDSATVVVDEVS
jgi:hypothetical protein